MENEITINIVTYPKSNLENDLNIIKSAFLYGDKVNLYSLTASMIMSLEIVKDLSFDEKIYLASELMEVYSGGLDNSSKKLMDMYFKLKSKKYKNKSELQHYITLQKIIGELITKMTSISKDKGGDELAKLIQKGMVNLKIFGLSIFEDESFNDRFSEEYLGFLKELLSSGNNYPLFDDGINSIVRAAINEGIIEASSRNILTGKKSGLSSGIILNLPNFERATADEIFDIKKEFQKPLLNYRAAIIKITNSIKSEQWSEDFIYEIEDIINAEVKPAINEIEEKIRDNNYLKRIAIGLFKDSSKVDIISIIGLGISAITPLIDISKAPLYSLGGIGIHMINQFIKYRDTLKDIRSNSFYYIYGAKKELEK